LALIYYYSHVLSLQEKAPGGGAALSRALADIRKAVREDRATSLAPALVRGLADGAFDGPDLFVPPLRDRYSRKLIWHDPDDAFVVIGMSWAPGQISPPHDHGGLWGGEIVVAGTMGETTFRFVGKDDCGRCRLVPHRHRLAPVGTVSMLLPPFEYHTVGNVGEIVARTVHVYRGNLESAQAFSAEGGDWYRPRRIELHYDG
jgi:3-mercaptopropionate dioxygenase